MRLSSSCFLVATVVATSSFFSLPANSTGVSPYLPLNLPNHIAQKIEQIAVIAGETSLNKPYKVAQITALARKIQTSHPLLFRDIAPYLRDHKERSSSSLMQVSLAASNSSYGAPYHFGVDGKSNILLEAAGYAMYSDHFGASASAIITENGVNRAQGLLHTGIDILQLDIGYKSRWWSVGRIDSLLLSNESEAFANLSASNVIPLTEYDINYEVFAGKLSNTTINSGDSIELDQPYITGASLSFSPVDQITLGLSHTTVFGGDIRENGSKEFFDALATNRLDSALNTPYADAQADRRYAIQARYSTEVVGFHYSIYGEHVTKKVLGDDSTQPSAATVGIYFPAINESSFRIEATRYDRGFYSSDIYGNGYQYDERALAHFVSSQAQNTSAKSITAQWFWSMGAENSLTTTFGWSQVVLLNESSNELVNSSLNFSADYRSRFQNVYWGVEASTGLDVLGERIYRVGVYLGF
ncbi:MAG: capsule assembly Wzi family protein [Pseudomonadota bacterium]|nr:capsule assembly Wzi family protein [Pseudomonadota bacterium]